jgi:hypothetical protein
MFRSKSQTATLMIAKEAVDWPSLYNDYDSWWKTDELLATDYLQDFETLKEYPLSTVPQLHVWLSSGKNVDIII